MYHLILFLALDVVAIPASGNVGPCRADKTIHSAAIDKSCGDFNIRELIKVLQTF